MKRRIFDGASSTRVEAQPSKNTAHAQAAKLSELAGYFPNLREIGRRVLRDKEPWAVEEFVDFMSRSKWIATRQGDPRLRAKFARVLARDANAFVDAASQDEAARRALRARFEDNKYVFFTKEPEPAPELSVVIPAFDVEDKVLALVAKLRALDLDLEVFVVDDGSADGAADALEAPAGVRETRCRGSQLVRIASTRVEEASLLRG